jgi:hypothetical protein
VEILGFIELNVYQTIFIVFYAILYGRMLGSVSVFIPFPWASLVSRDFKDKFRLSISLIILNLLPFVYFIWVFGLLGKSSFPALIRKDIFYWLGVYKELNIELFYTLLLALGVFGFYRLYHVLIIILGYFEMVYGKIEVVRTVSGYKINDGNRTVEGFTPTNGSRIRAGEGIVDGVGAIYEVPEFKIIMKRRYDKLGERLWFGFFGHILATVIFLIPFIDLIYYN